MGTQESAGTQGYNAILISTIVDVNKFLLVRIGYNAILISTIVDSGFSRQGVCGL